MKILSLIGMLLGLALIGISAFAYLSSRDLVAQNGIFMVCVLSSFIGGLFLFVFAYIVTKNQRWDKKSDYVPTSYSPPANY